MNEHESRCTTAARVMQPKVTTTAEGAAAEGAAAEGAAVAATTVAGSARPPLLLGCGHHHSSACSQGAEASVGTFRVLCHAYGAADRSTRPAPDLVLFFDSTFRDLSRLPDAEFPHQPADQRSSVAVCDQGQW